MCGPSGHSRTYVRAIWARRSVRIRFHCGLAKASLSIERSIAKSRSLSPAHRCISQIIDWQRDLRKDLNIKWKRDPFVSDRM